MIGDTIGITYNAVAKTLNKVNQDAYGADYYLDDTTMRFYISVKHTIPSRGKFGESHLMRLNVEYLDAGGVLLRTASAWTVIRTDDANQDYVTSQRVVAALLTATTTANTNKLLGRES
jgi:hypothetical protein